MSSDLDFNVKMLLLLELGFVHLYSFLQFFMASFQLTYKTKSLRDGTNTGEINYFLLFGT